MYINSEITPMCQTSSKVPQRPQLIGAWALALGEDVAREWTYLQLGQEGEDLHSITRR